MTTVVHCKKSSYDVYIGRPSKWGNPFTLGEDGNIEDARKELKDKILGCWCSPQLCHGDVLAFVAAGNDL